MMYIEGFIAVKAAIKAKNRTVHKVLISSKKRTKKTSYMKQLCEQEQIPYSFVTPEEIEQHAVGNTHGGFLADVSNRVMLDLEELFSAKRYYYITGVEDPYNLGSIIRTLYSAGADGVLLDNRDWTDVEHIITKSSAGTYEYMPIALVDSIHELENVKELGYQFVLVDQTEEATDLYETTIMEPFVVIIGGEKRGISNEVSALATQTVYIPYGRTFGYSLPATIAATVVSYELFRRSR